MSKAKKTRPAVTVKKTAKAKVEAKTQGLSTYGTIEKALKSTARRIRKIASNALSSDEPLGATELLIAQHRIVEKLFSDLESANGNTVSCLKKLADNLAAHMSIEERVFYPAIRQLDEGLILEGLEEHAMGRFALERLVTTKPNHESFKARTKALKELMVNHHEEEERELFPKARKALPKEALIALGKEMKALFAQTLEAGYSAALARQDESDSKAQSKEQTSKSKPMTARGHQRHALS
jgi:hypothetical protein